MFFNHNYSKPGKGVQKRDPNKPRISIFFELLLRKLWNLCKVNLVYISFAIPTFFVVLTAMGGISGSIINLVKPIVAKGIDLVADGEALETSLLLFDTIIRFYLTLMFMVFLGLGPVTAGVTYVLRNYGREEHAWLISDTWQQSKSNFWQALVVWLIDIFVVYAIFIAFNVYVSLGGFFYYLSYVVIVIAIVYLMMHLYIYQVMVTFKLPITKLFKNSLIFALSKAPRNLLLLAILTVIHIGIPFLMIVIGAGLAAFGVFIVLEVVLLIAVSGFTTNFFIYPELEKYIKAAQNKEIDKKSNI